MAVNQIPAAYPQKGTYVLILHLADDQAARIGKLGRFDLRAGCYAYVGSAFGPGGLGGRLKHHLAPVVRPHWHIDYLRQIASLEQIWLAAAAREHDWAAILREMPGASLPIPRFGASDCDCASHLAYYAEAPLPERFREQLIRHFPADAPVQQVIIR